MNNTDIKLIETAAAIMDEAALELRICHTLAPLHNDWTGEDEAKAAHDEVKSTSDHLYALADKMKAALSSVQAVREQT